jgi:hypothetical protein
MPCVLNGLNNKKTILEDVKNAENKIDAGVRGHRGRGQ